MRQKDDNKEAAIRQKAIEMIVKEGFDGLSMQKLAKAADLSASTIYIYFENREDLLNKLYAGVEEIFEQEAIKDFEWDLSFKDGLWLQWSNRYRYIEKHPLYFRFSEQFRNSPLITRQVPEANKFRYAMQQFVKQATRNKEIPDLPVEIFWAMAYGPFYTLVKFHLDQSSMNGKQFSLTTAKLKQTFDLVIKSLTP